MKVFFSNFVCTSSLSFCQWQFYSLQNIEWTFRNGTVIFFRSFYENKVFVNFNCKKTFILKPNTYVQFLIVHYAQKNWKIKKDQNLVLQKTTHNNIKFKNKKITKLNFFDVQQLSWLRKSSTKLLWHFNFVKLISYK